MLSFSVWMASGHMEKPISLSRGQEQSDLDEA